jgi:hypothetical protein
MKQSLSHDTLGDHAAFFLRSCAFQGAAEQLLMDILTFEVS